jgi:Rrf2 family protein
VEFTREADYAMRAVVHLSRLPMGSRVPTTTIAEAEVIPRPFLSKVVSHLVTARLVNTMRGKGGGVALARPPEEITLLQVTEAVDGPIGLNHCLLRSGICDADDYCSAHDLWSEIQASFVKDLDAVTMADLARREFGP